jgi:3-oxoacyl-[acyl-carrier-protein] synthase II
MQLALKSAGLIPADVQYLNAHATSTPLGDRAEARAIADTFGERTEKLLVSSTKSMTGHLLGGAGSLEAGITVLALRDQIAPPTTNIEEVDQGCKLNLVRDKGLPSAMEFAMTNSFGFGGTNASLIFRKW